MADKFAYPFAWPSTLTIIDYHTAVCWANHHGFRQTFFLAHIRALDAQAGQSALVFIACGHSARKASKRGQ